MMGAVLHMCMVAVLFHSDMSEKEIRLFLERAMKHMRIAVRALRTEDRNKMI